MKIAYDAKRYYHNRTGLGNYSRTLVENVKGTGEVEAVLYDAGALERTFRLGRRAKKDGCQLYHGLSNELPRDVRKAGIPSVVTMHDVAWREFPAMYKPWDRAVYDWKYGWSARNATRVVCISEATKHDVMRYYDVAEERIRVIYQPVAREYYDKMPGEEARQVVSSRLEYLKDKPYILTVGSINSRKNLLGMVKAYEMLPEKERPEFVVVGNGREYRREVERYIAEHGMADHVHIESNIHDTRMLQALYTEAVCLMYPSFCEGFGLPVVEASLQECAVVTSNVSSLPEAAGSSALQCDPCNVGELYEALRLLVENEHERKSRGEAGREYCVENFSPERLTNKWISLYRELC